MKKASKKMKWIASVEFAIQGGMVFLSGLAILLLIINLLFFRGHFPTANANFLVFYTAFSAFGWLTLFMQGCWQHQIESKQKSGVIIDV